MKKVTKRGYAKINLFLDVVGKTEEFHDLDTVVVTVNLYDVVTVSARKDEKIVLKSGGLYRVNLDAENDNAYKAAKLFQENFSTRGVDISVKKNIPLFGGLGGSSADIAATLLAMKELFSVEEDVKPLADRLSSDGGYLLEGGYARLTGKGENVERLNLKNKLHFVVCTPKGGVSTSECFRLFDENPTKTRENGSLNLISALENNDIKREYFYNALLESAVRLNEEIDAVYRLIGSLSPLCHGMSGSGSSVFCIFETKELALWARDKIKKLYPQTVYVESMTKEEIVRASEPLFKSPWRIE